MGLGPVAPEAPQPGAWRPESGPLTYGSKGGSYNRPRACENQNKARPAADQVSELTTNRLSVYLRCLDLTG